MDTTRIMDLPDPYANPREGFSNNYQPIDTHPNPYGHPPPSLPSIPKPDYRLPSRDIPMDQGFYTHDEQVQPNYIPDVKKYMKEADETNDRQVEKHTHEKSRRERFDQLVEEGQIPFMVALLFFIFHMPIVDQYVKNFSFLSLQGMDGQFNMYGLIFKSILFGTAYYSLSNAVNYLSDVF